MVEKTTYQRKPLKSPGLAGFLALIPGIGAIYNSQLFKGIIFIIIYGGIITMMGQGAPQPFTAFLFVAFCVYMITEAVQTAKSINRRILAEGKEEAIETEEIFLEVKSGSILWGIILMLLGGIFLLAGNTELISYDDVFNLWPVAVVGIGLKLIVDYFSKK